MPDTPSQTCKKPAYRKPSPGLGPARELPDELSSLSGFGTLLEFGLASAMIPGLKRVVPDVEVRKRRDAWSGWLGCGFWSEK
jgi:hypothetical protein